MSSLARAQSATGFSESRHGPWLALLKRLAERLRSYRARRRQYGELLDYLASDHRAAADIGVTSGEARSLSQRPFWRV